MQTKTMTNPQKINTGEIRKAQFRGDFSGGDSSHSGRLVERVTKDTFNLGSGHQEKGKKKKKKLNLARN